MILLDVSVVNVALPGIGQDLHGNGEMLQWIVSGYALTLGLMLVPAGRFGDMQGRRFVFKLGALVLAEELLDESRDLWCD